MSKLIFWKSRVFNWPHEFSIFFLLAATLAELCSPFNLFFLFRVVASQLKVNQRKLRWRSYQPFPARCQVCFWLVSPRWSIGISCLLCNAARYCRLFNPMKLPPMACNVRSLNKCLICILNRPECTLKLTFKSRYRRFALCRDGEWERARARISNTTRLLHWVNGTNYSTAAWDNCLVIERDDAANVWRKWE